MLTTLCLPHCTNTKNVFPTKTIHSPTSLADMIRRYHNYDLAIIMFISNNDLAMIMHAHLASFPIRHNPSNPVCEQRLRDPHRYNGSKMNSERFKERRTGLLHLRQRLISEAVTERESRTELHSFSRVHSLKTVVGCRVLCRCQYFDQWGMPQGDDIFEVETLIPNWGLSS